MWILTFDVNITYHGFKYSLKSSKHSQTFPDIFDLYGQNGKICFSSLGKYWTNLTYN